MASLNLFDKMHKARSESNDGPQSPPGGDGQAPPNDSQTPPGGEGEKKP